MPPPVATALLALGALLIAAAMRRRLGPDADWVETIRTYSLPILDPLVERRFGGSGTAYQLGDDEFVAHVDADPEDVEHRLWEAGCRRNYIAARKSVTDGRSEASSWAYRGDPLPAYRQVHIMLFPGVGGGTDIYAHAEYSSELSWAWRNPTVLYWHYSGHFYRPAEGEWFVRRYILPKMHTE